MSNQERERNSNPDYPDGILFFPRKANEPEWKYGKLILTIDDILDFIEKHPDAVTSYKNRKQLKLDICRSTKSTSTVDNPEAYAKTDRWDGGQKQETVSKGSDDDLFDL